MKYEEQHARVMALVHELRKITVAHTDSLSDSERRYVGLDAAAALLAYGVAEGARDFNPTNDGLALMGAITETLRFPDPRNQKIWERACVRAVQKMREEGLVDPW